MNRYHPHSPLLDRGFIWPRQCVSCDDAAPECNCAADENCVLTSRTCSQCPTIVCNKKPGAGGGGVNAGAIAGPIVAVMVIGSLLLFWYLRRKKKRDLARLEELAARARKAEAAGFQLSHPGSPVPGSLHSARSPNDSSRLSIQPNSARRSQQPPRVGRSSSGFDPNNPNHPYRAKSPKIYEGGGNESGSPFSDKHSQNSQGTESSWETRIIPIVTMSPGEMDRRIAAGYAQDRIDALEEAHERFLASLDEKGFNEAINHDREHSGGSGNSGGTNGSNTKNGRPVSAAARTLNEARENLKKGNSSVPARPARDPKLDLRLNTSAANLSKDDLDALSPNSRSGGGIRDSYLSANSGAPSFSSGYTADLNDAPKIFTSKHIQMGRFQQAEVVQWPNNNKSNTEVLDNNQQYQNTPISPSLSAVRSPYDSADGNYRTLTPLNGEDGIGSSTTPTDLRFSMGSLAYRDSISSLGTERYLASPGGAGGSGNHQRDMTPSSSINSFGMGPGGVPLPRPGFMRDGDNTNRESIMSDQSSSSVLSGFPMIHPNQPTLLNSQHQQRQILPQSTSTNTLDGGHIPRPEITTGITGVSKPPPAFKAPSTNNNNNNSRPNTGVSTDSILGDFPFVNSSQTNRDAENDMPGTALPTSQTARRTIGNVRNTQMSGVSEGLGGFEFRFEDGENIPPVPK